MEMGVLVFISSSRSLLWKYNLWAEAWRKSKCEPEWSWHSVPERRNCKVQDSETGVYMGALKATTHKPARRVNFEREKGRKKEAREGRVSLKTPVKKEGGLGRKCPKRRPSSKNVLAGRKSLNQSYLLNKFIPCRNGLSLIPWLCRVMAGRHLWEMCPCLEHEGRSRKEATGALSYVPQNRSDRGGRHIFITITTSNTVSDITKERWPSISHASPKN